MRGIILATAVAVFAGLAGPAAANPFTRVYVFGDSTVDTGWYRISPFSGIAAFDTFLMQSSTLGIGKPTTNPGPVSVQTLASTLGRNANPQNQGGTDYATSGARNEELNNTGFGFFVNAIPTTKQIDSYLQTHTPNGKALYVVSSGGNDVSFAVKQVEGNQIDDTAGRSIVTTAAHQLADKIAALQSANARFIIVTRLPNSFGADQKTMDYRLLYNQALTNKLGSLGVTEAFARVNALRKKIKNNMADFGLTSVTTSSPSCSKPDLTTQINSAWALVCSPDSPVSQPNHPSRHLFADDQHWATGGQRILGSYYYCLARHTWPNLFNGYTAQPPTTCSHFSSIF